MLEVKKTWTCKIWFENKNGSYQVEEVVFVARLGQLFDLPDGVGQKVAHGVERVVRVLKKPVVLFDLVSDLDGQLLQQADFLSELALLGCVLLFQILVSSRVSAPLSRHHLEIKTKDTALRNSPRGR